LVFATAAAAADSDDMSAEVDRILRSSAESVRSMFSGLGEDTMLAFAGISVGGEFEELEVLEHIARSEGGREIIAASCRKAVTEGDAALQMLAYTILAEIDQADASAILPEMYATLGSNEVFMLASIASSSLYIDPESTADPGTDALYELVERDLREGDGPASLKAAKLVAMMHTERAGELAVIGMESPDPGVRRWCVLSVLTAYYDTEEPSPTRIITEKALADEDATVRSFAARQLGMMGDPEYLPQLYELLEDDDVGVRRAAAASANSLFSYAPAEDKKDAAKKLLKKLKAEPDGVTRCYLGQAYGAAASDPEGVGRYLSDDGYWAFYSGEWNEKDIDGYYETYDGGSWGGG
jgi:HEAT repeat protein